MKLKILFFGSLAECTGTTMLEVEDIQDIDTLKNHLNEQFPPFKKFTYLIAVNQHIEKENIKLKTGDEIALMPPFAGG